MSENQKKIQEELKKLQASKLAKQTDAQLARGDFLANLAKEQASDPEWLKANKEGARKRKQDPNWQKNHAKALNKINADTDVSKKRNKSIQEVTSTSEWKAKQLAGCKDIRGNNPDWANNISVGHEKLRQKDEYWKQRAEVASKLTNNDKHRQATKEGVKDRWNKPENLSKCPHCEKLVDNANYKRWHGDNCRLKNG